MPPPAEGIYPPELQSAHKRPPFLKRHKVISIGIIIIAFLTILELVTWPESTADLSYEGEVWGDLTAEGYIWGHQRSDHDFCCVSQYASMCEETLTISVTNVSRVRLFDPPDGDRINKTVDCINSTFVIIPEPEPRYDSSVNGDWHDIDVRCVFSDFNGTFEGTDTEYYDRKWVSRIWGTARVIHDESASYDIDIDDCIVIIDGIEYVNSSWLYIPEGEVANLTITGRGGIGVGTNLHPHINGTLEVDDFVRLKIGFNDEYQKILFDGEDIEVRTIRSSYEFSHWGHVYEPWVIEITVPEGTEVEIQEIAKLPIGINIVLMVVIISLVIVVGRSIVSIIHREREERGSTPPEGHEPR